MKKIISNMIFGRGNALSGAIAFGVVALIALGCTCGKNFDLSNLGTENSNSGRTSSSNTSSNTFGDSDSKRHSDSTKPDASKGLIPPTDDQLQDMARETMLDFNDAIAKADFTDFYSTICKEWQSQTTPEGMKQMFQAFIDGRASFGEIKDMDATLSTRKVTKEGKYKTLEVDGEYATSPNPTTFELNYLAQGTEWKLSKIKVVTTIYTH
jgi:hypothetical protein